MALPHEAGFSIFLLESKIQKEKWNLFIHLTPDPRNMLKAQLSAQQEFS